MPLSENSVAKNTRGRNPKSVSVVIPCFNEQEVLPQLHARLSTALSALALPYQVVFVDDGSCDNTWQLLADLQERDGHLQAIKLSRNFGHQLALTCGLDHAFGEVVVVLDADLQDPPELIPEMIARWKEGYDIVYAKRRSRGGETASKKLFAFMFYRVFRKITGFSIPEDTGDCRLMDHRALKALQSMREHQRFVRGMVSWVGFHQTAVLYDRPPRAAGTTKYPVRKSLLLAVDAITSFSYLPLRFASFIGMIVSGFSLFYILVVFVKKALGQNLPGYTSTMAAVLFLGGVQLLFLGILGEYVGRIYEQGKHRPLYLIDHTRGNPTLPEVS